MDVRNSVEELASWTRQRTSEELQAFVENRHAALPLGIDLGLE
jgi:hypothetical protein